MTRSINVKTFLLALSVVFVFAACSSKDEISTEYNKPAIYWYNKMINQISFGDIDLADDTYTSLESEHRNSPLIPTAILILVNAHIDAEEYALANFYLDEYIKRFTLSKNIDYARYLKIKANFLGFKYQNRDQKLINETIEDIKDFKIRYSSSAYIPLVDTMNARLYMAKALLDEEIANLYEKKGKEEAAKIYRQRVKNSWIDPENIVPVEVPFYRAIFE